MENARGIGTKLKGGGERTYSWLTGVLAFFLLAFGAIHPVRAQDINVEGVVRSLSLYFAIRTICPQFFPIDPVVARNWEQMYLDVGAKMVGEEKLRALMNSEMLRRNKEVRVTGPAQWCNYQRGNLERLGVKDVFVESRTKQPKIIVKSEGGTFVVPVEINGALTLDFTIDSGAADVSIPADVFSTLVRTGTIKESDITGNQTYVLADGSRSESVTFLIRSLKIGSKVVENVKGTIAPAKGSLLLGQSFLGRFRSWSIDNKTNEILLNE
jgi:clan AA aspartic protease (TIGR02281 family)